RGTKAPALCAVVAAPALVSRANRVDRADPGRELRRGANTFEEGHFVRNGDARPTHIEGLRELDEIIKVDRWQRQIHRVDVGGAERRIVHRRRDRVRYWRSDHAVKGRRSIDVPEAKFVDQRLRRYLSNTGKASCVRPLRTQTRCERSRGQSVLAHSDQYEVVLPRA